MIETLKQLCPSFAERILDFRVHAGYFLIGCSATNFDGKLVASAWASDHIYNVERARYEQYPGNRDGLPGNPRSHRPPYLVSLNDNLDVTSAELIEAPQYAPGGFDGLKPFEWNGELWCDYYTGGLGTVQFFLGRLDGARLITERQLTAPGPRRDEKNWMPEVRGGNELIYHYDASTTACLNPRPAPVSLYAMGPREFKSLHGGTQVVHNIAVVHDFHYEGNGRVYRHYFVRFDFAGVPVALSRPFVLRDVERVEVVTGLAKHPDGKSLVLSHGPFVCTLDLAEVWRMPWDGVPQPVAPRRPPPPTPSRSHMRREPQRQNIRRHQ